MLQSHQAATRRDFMVAAFYFLILTGQRLETREQIFTISPVISVFLSPVQWEQGTAQLLGCQLRLGATPQVSPQDLAWAVGKAAVPKL